MYKLELINIILAIPTVYLIYRSNIINSLIIFAGYFCFQYSYLYLPVLLDSYTVHDINTMRVIGSGIISKALQLLVIGVFLLKNKSLLKMKLIPLNLYIIINFLMAVGFILQYINIGFNDRLVFQYYLSLCLFLWIVFIPYRINNVIIPSYIITERVKNIIILIIILVSIFGLYEVWINKSWAQTQVSLNENVYRSSSLFYNPNLFAYYSVLAYFGLIYLSDQEERINIKTNIIALSLMFAIFITGSRGIYLFLIISIAVLIILNKKISLLYFYPYALYLISALLSIVMENHFPALLDDGNSLLKNFYYLSNRFYDTPLDIFRYTLNRMNISLINDIIHPHVNSAASANSQSSIDGRFCNGCDNGWMILYRDFGFFGVLAFLLLYLHIFITICTSKKIYWKSKYILISSVIFIILVGSSMRFQILPVSIVTSTYIALLLIITKKINRIP